MKRIVLTVLLVASFAHMACAAEDLSAQVSLEPPPSARPWVYWFPLSGNLSKEGITADLEALQRVGIGGVLYMEVDQGARRDRPISPGPLWRELFQHACKEANRLGLEINMNNDAGWCGSGGPWITPELSMQRVVWTETVVKGPKSFDGLLAQAGRPSANFYQDIAVLAMPAPEGKARIQDIQGNRRSSPQHFPPQRAKFAALPAESVIPRDRIVDLTGKMDAAGKLAWDVPAGQVARLASRPHHDRQGQPSRAGIGPRAGMRQAQQGGGRSPFQRPDGPADRRQPRLLPARARCWSRRTSTVGKSARRTGRPACAKNSRSRRGYDLLPLLPTFTGRVVDSLEVSERFLWDLRQTVSDMLIENYAGHFRTLANRHGLRLSIEAYDGVPCDEMTYAGQADEPMAEFWSWDKFGAAYSCTEMASAAHVYGKQILGAEAFTATDAEKWQGHPAYIKDLGDWAFCEGINRFVFHRYAMQPWTNPNRARACRWAPGDCTTSGRKPGGSNPRRGTNTWPAASTSCSKACLWPTSATCSPRAPRGGFRRRRRR